MSSVNFDHRWLSRNGTNFFMIDDFKKGSVMNFTQNKTAIIIHGEAKHDLF